MMKQYVDMLDQPALQTALDAIAGPGVFETGRDKLPNGSRPLYYQALDNISPDWITQAAAVATQLDQQYLTNIKTGLMSSLMRASIKSRQRQPSLIYSAQDQTQAQAWLDSMTNPVPLVVQARAQSLQISNQLAAEQIVASYTQYTAYTSQIDQAVLDGQSNIQAATTVYTAKIAYQHTVESLAELENTDYGLN